MAVNAQSSSSIPHPLRAISNSPSGQRFQMVFHFVWHHKPRYCFGISAACAVPVARNSVAMLVRNKFFIASPDIRLLHGGNEGWRVEADCFGQVDQLDYVKPPLATLEARDPRLRSFELLGELNLPDIGLFALSSH
jgi:hypothetical protein